MPRHQPWCPPIVLLQPGDIVGHLLAWTWHEHEGKWHAWVSWVQGTSARPVHKVVEVEARQLRPLEAPDAYTGVPRRVLGRGGQVRRWEPRGGQRSQA
jgi:hypothetical protein